MSAAAVTRRSVDRPAGTGCARRNLASRSPIAPSLALCRRSLPRKPPRGRTSSNDEVELRSRPRLRHLRHRRHRRSRPACHGRRSSLSSRGTTSSTRRPGSRPPRRGRPRRRATAAAEAAGASRAVEPHRIPADLAAGGLTGARRSCSAAISMSELRPRATPQAIAASGVVTHGRALRSTTSSMDADWAIVYWSVLLYAASIARSIAPSCVRQGMNQAVTPVMTAAMTRAAPPRSPPLASRLTVQKKSGIEATTSSRATASHMPTTRVGLPGKPALLDRQGLQVALELGDCRQQLVGVRCRNEAVGPRQRADGLVQAGLGRRDLLLPGP